MNDKKKARIAIINAGPGALFGGQEQYCIDIAAGLSDYFDFTIVCPEGKLAENSRKHGLKVIALPLRRNLWTANKAFKSMLTAENFSILHSMDSRGNYFARASAKSFPNVARISTRHELYQCRCFGTYFRLKRKVIALFDKSTAGSANKIIAVSGAVRDEMLKLGYSEDKVEVVYSGIQDEKAAGYAENARSSIRKEDQIIAVGRLSKEKGFEDLIEVIGAIAPVLPEGKLKIAGDGPMRDVLVDKIKKLGHSGRVELLGYVDDIGPLLLESSIMAAPSLHESFGLAIVEGMAAGLPIVASRIGGIPEVVRDGENGILVEAGDVKALANGLLTLLSDEAIRKRFGEASMERVRANFLLSDTLRKTQAIYESTLQAHIGARHLRLPLRRREGN